MNTSSIVNRLRFLLAFFVFLSLTSYSQLKIYCLDVNQGDATLVISPDRKTLLIDAGLKKDADEIVEILKQENITEIDYAVLTHFDTDHRAGFALLKEKGYTFKHPVYDHSGKPPKGYTAAVGRRAQIKPGFEFTLGDEVTVNCLTSRRRIQGGTAPRVSASNYGENQNSVALLIKYKEFEVFIGGDLTTNVEESLVDGNFVPDVDVYHVSHHGSPTSSGEEFVRELEPEVSVVSNGIKFDHPTKEVVDRLEEYGSVVYQTNKNTSGKASVRNVAAEFIGDLDPAKDKGTVLITVGDRDYEVSLERKAYKNGKKYPIDIAE